jgi:hypothetical protein
LALLRWPLLIALLMSQSAMLRLCDSCPMRHGLFAWIWMTVSIAFRAALGRTQKLTKV